MPLTKSDIDALVDGIPGRPFKEVGGLYDKEYLVAHNLRRTLYVAAGLTAEGDKPLLQERYWCGCVREARWAPRCKHHAGLEHDVEPPSIYDEDKRAKAKADGQRKPERVRCWLWSYLDGKPFHMEFNDPTDRISVGEDERLTPGWFVPDGAE